MKSTTVKHDIKSEYLDIPHPPTLSTVKQFCDKYPAFTQGSLRNLIFLSKDRETSKGIINGNGFDVAIIRIGRKLLIDEVKFFKQLEALQEEF